MTHANSMPANPARDRNPSPHLLTHWGAIFVVLAAAAEPGIAGLVVTWAIGFAVSALCLLLGIWCLVRPNNPLIEMNYEFWRYLFNDEIAARITKIQRVGVVILAILFGIFFFVTVLVEMISRLFF